MNQVHLWACRQGLRLVALRSLTFPYLSALVDAATTHAEREPGQPPEAASTHAPRLPTPAEVAASERVVALPFGSFGSSVRFGVSLASYLASSKKTALNRGPEASGARGDISQFLTPSYVELFAAEPFIAIARACPWWRTGGFFGPLLSGRCSRKLEVLVFLREGASVEDELRAATFGLVCLRQLKQGEQGGAMSWTNRELLDGTLASLEEFGGWYVGFRSLLEESAWGPLGAGQVRLRPGPWRVTQVAGGMG
mmetsp:Transcript_42413/g.95981  ORF Transcript_42413/g.95981 Transcript_42413/m.95981 type:complete len:253 (-) Transcript_42413:197-955(-)